MAGNNLTIKDIAKMARVSPTAVSFVLNGKNGISQETRDRVEAVIRETDFHPSLASRRLSSRKSFNVAVVYPKSASPFDDMFYHEVTSGVFEEAQRENYNVVFTQLRGEPSNYHLPDVILKKDADGVIFLQDISQALLNEAEQSGVPFVLVDLHMPDPVHTHVSVDVDASIYAVVTYLIEQGHKRIGLLGSDLIPANFLNGFSGYQRALFNNGLLMHPGWVRKNAHDEAAVASELNALLGLEEPVTAVCCIGDILAIYAIKAARLKGMSLPRDLSLAGTDDLLISRYSDPPLTTVSYDNQNMGKTAVRLLFQKMSDEKTESVIVPSSNLIIRESVAPLHK